MLESEIFITKEEKFRMINEFQELNLFIPEDHEILFQLNPTSDSYDIPAVIISLINDTLYRLIKFSHDNDNDKLPFWFFKDHSQLSYFRYTKDISCFLEGFMGDYHSKFLE